uniref:RING-type domain-containing protein n=1 Tax=Clytia hemisphaerica TaxID=252671 RepID=A0A7M5X5V6_9CNID|eukprot:TCONS_00001553-protein
MNYPSELILPFCLLIMLIVLYIAQKLFGCSCFKKPNNNRDLVGENYRDHYGLILEESRSFNNDSSKDSYLARFDFGCCFFLITNKLHSASLMYIPHADKFEYGTVDITGEPNNHTSKHSINDVCPICFETFTIKQKIVLLDCQHAFHSTCIAKWLKKCVKKHKGTCPLCKDFIDTEIVYTNCEDGAYAFDVLSTYSSHSDYGQQRTRESYALGFANV